MICWRHVDLHFQSIFLTTEHLFFTISGIRFGIKIKQQIMFFQTLFLDIIFLILFRCFQKTIDLGPLQNLVGARMDPKSTKLRQKANTKHKM